MKQTRKILEKYENCLIQNKKMYEMAYLFMPHPENAIPILNHILIEKQIIRYDLSCSNIIIQLLIYIKRLDEKAIWSNFTNHIIIRLHAKTVFVPIILLNTLFHIDISLCI